MNKQVERFGQAKQTEPNQHAEPNQIQQSEQAEPSTHLFARLKRFTPLLTFLFFIFVGLLAGWMNWFIVIAALVFMIFMHELGHYLTARWAGMKVTEFFIGFGPRIWSFKWGETEYGIKAIWAGAYVRIIGMNNLDTVNPGEESRSFRSKSYPKKVIVLAAGSASHFLMALILLFTMLLVEGQPVQTDALEKREDWTLATVVNDSAAYDAGLQTGDRLISVDGVAVTNFAEFGRYVSSEAKGKEVVVVYNREDVEISATVTVGERLTAQGAAGIDKLEPGDRILGIEGLNTKNPPSYAEIVQYVSPRLDEKFDFIVSDAETGQRTIIKNVAIAEMIDESEATVGFFGISPLYERKNFSLISAATESVKSFFSLLVDTTVTFPTVFASGVMDAVNGIIGIGSDDPSPIELGGTVQQPEVSDLEENQNRILSIYGVARLGAEVASDGTMNILVLMIFVNVFIGVFNLLPLMPFDGGHIAVATYERIRSIGGRAYHVDAVRLLPVTYVVVFLLALVGGFTLIRDILDPVSFG